ncbi:MAG: hypothetical protein H6836_02065 [Planctomycetes bacterium]|nr:hypothetical protein [Planctomycetota bacterium]
MIRRSPIPVLPVLLLLAESSVAQSLVRDLNPIVVTNGSSPDSFAVLPGGARAVLFANAFDDGKGKEPWVTDGTAVGTSLLADLTPGGGSSSGSFTYPVGNKLLLFASAAGLGVEPWVTDGTAAGTILLQDINPGSGSSFGFSVVTLGGKVYFQATSPSTGTEMWETDGTVAGTKVLDVVPGSGSGYFASPAVLGTRIVYFGSTPATGVELMISDGTSANTTVLKEFNPGTASSAGSFCATVGSKVFFHIQSPFASAGLWVTDGTASGTVWLGGPADARYPAAFGSSLLFGAKDANGREVWISDGTPAGTQLVKDIDPGRPDGLRTGFTVVGNRAYFWAKDANGFEPWTTDGTTAGTSLLKNIRTNGEPRYLTSFVPLGGLVYFSGDDESFGGEVWQTDGTTAGTKLVADIWPGKTSSDPRMFGTWGNRLVFAADDGSRGRELYTMVPGQPPQLVKDIGGGALPVSSQPRFGVNLDDGSSLFLASTTRGGNVVLGRTDGTSAGTRIVTELSSDPRTSVTGPWHAVKFHGLAYFNHETATHGSELWATDGTAAGTRLFLDLEPGVTGSKAIPWRVVGGRLLFVATVQGQPQLWATDGTVAGTQVLANQTPLTDARLGEELFFTVGNPTSQKHMWKTDGTPAGTGFVMTLNSVSGRIFGRLGDRLLLNFGSTSFGDEPWISDGTPAGTQLLADVYPGSASSIAGSYTEFGKLGVFTAQHPSYGEELWVTDGTTAGTMLLRDIRPGYVVGGDWQFVVAGDLLFFLVDDRVHGTELWRTDGTTTGTVLVRDVWPGANPGARILGPGGADRKIVFAADDGTTGLELWTSDGTSGGTRRLQEIEPGAGSSNPGYFFAAGERIYFAASYSTVGEELFAVTYKEIAAGRSTQYGYGCPGTGGIRPQMASAGAPTIGTSAFQASLTKGRANAVCGLALGAQRVSVPLGSSCRLWVDPLAVLVFGRTDGAGQFSLSAPIPNQPTLVGLSIVITGFVEDPQGAFANQLSIADALQVVFGG